MDDTDRSTTIDGNQVAVEHSAKGSLALIRLAAIKAWIREGNDGLLPDPNITDGMESTGRVYKVTLRLHDRAAFQRYASVVRWIDDGIPSGPFETDTSNATDDGSTPVNADGSDGPTDDDDSADAPKDGTPSDSL